MSRIQQQGQMKMIELWRALAMLCDGTLLLGLKKKKRVLQLP